MAACRSRARTAHRSARSAAATDAATGYWQDRPDRRHWSCHHWSCHPGYRWYGSLRARRCCRPGQPVPRPSRSGGGPRCVRLRRPGCFRCASDQRPGWRPVLRLERRRHRRKRGLGTRFRHATGADRVTCIAGSRHSSTEFDGRPAGISSGFGLAVYLTTNSSLAHASVPRTCPRRWPADRLFANDASWVTARLPALDGPRYPTIAAPDSHCATGDSLMATVSSRSVHAGHQMRG